MTPQVYISDTNIWIDLRNAGLLDAMFDLPLTLCCTDFVLSELKDFDHQHCLRVAWWSKHWMSWRLPPSFH